MAHFDTTADTIITCDARSYCNEVCLMKPNIWSRFDPDCCNQLNENIQPLSARP